MSKVKNIVDNVTNGGKETIERSLPYQVKITLEGTSDLLFHRWNCEEITAKANAARGSTSKKTDNVESYVYRDDNKNICIPSEYLRMSIISAAKYKTDPRSTRKSAMDLYKAGICCLNTLSSLGTKKWDYDDKRRVVIQRSGINRIRPAMKAGWKACFELMVNIPEYISTIDLHDTIQTAGRLVGLGDFRPSYGRFNVIEFKVA